MRKALEISIESPSARAKIVWDYRLSSLRNNVIVVEILDAARRSAATGQSVRLA